MDLHVFWFALLTFMLIVYAVLDGFDLGVGLVLNALAHTEEERRTFHNCIAPLWDGNEVWLVCFGGAFFGAFPVAYGTAFSGFYLPFMALLFSLLLRAVAMELRNQESWPWWRRLWDLALGLACLTTCVVFGFILANAVAGVPLGPHHEFRGTLSDLEHPLAALVGFKYVMLFALHGALYLRLRIARPSELYTRITRASWMLWVLYLLDFAVTTNYAVHHVPWTYTSALHMAAARTCMILKVACMLGTGVALAYPRPWPAFVLSAANIACLGFLYACVLFPNLIVSHADPALNLTIYNAASTEGTLSLMRWVAFAGMPLAIGYTFTIYWVFRAKARPDQEE